MLDSQNMGMKKGPEILDLMADAVLAYRPKPKSKAAKKRRRKAVRAYPSGKVRSVADQVAAGAVIPRRALRASDED